LQSNTVGFYQILCKFVYKLHDEVKGACYPPFEFILLKYAMKKAKKINQYFGHKGALISLNKIG
jgi:hypothetical protein